MNSWRLISPRRYWCTYRKRKRLKCLLFPREDTGDVIRNPARETTSRRESAGILVLGFPVPIIGRHTCVLFKSPSPWYLGIAPQAKAVCYLCFKSARSRKLLLAAKQLLVALAENILKETYAIMLVILLALSRAFPWPWLAPESVSEMIKQWLSASQPGNPWHNG